MRHDEGASTLGPDTRADERVDARAPNRVELAEAIEALLVRGPAASAFLRYLEIPGITASMGPGVQPEENRVGCTDLAADTVEASVRHVGATFRSAGRGARWYVTPASRPSDLRARLEGDGWRRNDGARLVGMARSLDREEQPADARARAAVQRVGVDDLRRHVDVLAEGFGSTTQEWLGTLDMLAAGALPGCRFEHYLAYEGGVPVAFASSLHDEGRRVTLLGGSAVRPAARGRGHYRALVQARLDEARSQGSRAAVVQSNPATSAPILERLGFERVVAIEAYDLAPPTRAAPPLDT